MHLSWLYSQLFIIGIFHVYKQIVRAVWQKIPSVISFCRIALTEYTLMTYAAVDAIDFGEKATEGEFPYLAFISISQKMKSSWCGGAILDKTHILTAAHCVTNGLAPIDRRFVKVMVGLTRVHRLWSKELSIARITVHPKYRLPKCPGCADRLLAQLCIKPPISDYFKAKDDIAVLTMEKPLPMGPNVQKIDYLYHDSLPYGETCKFAGWGLNYKSDALILEHDLTWVNLKVLNPSDCATLLLPSSPGDFCARDVEKEAMTLLGDSGSPLVCHGVLVGILSMGTEERGRPDIFVRIRYYKNFIEKVLKE